MPAALSARAVTVGGVRANYAFGPETGPHLYWREGAVLHTVSGPFPVEDLVAVADSLSPVARPVQGSHQPPGCPTGGGRGSLAPGPVPLGSIRCAV